MVYQPSEDLVLSATVVQDDDQQVIEGLSLRRIAWRRLKQDRVALAGGITLVLIVLVAAFASQLTELIGQQPNLFHSSLIDPDTTLPYGSFGGVSTHHWLGVEPTNGRDMLARLIAGCRTSLLISGASTLVSLVLGAVTGVVAGYYGGAVDALLTFLFDIWLLSRPAAGDRPGRSAESISRVPRVVR